MDITSLKKDLACWRQELMENRMRLHIAPDEVRYQGIPGKPFHLHPEVFIQLGGESIFSFPKGKLVLKKKEIAIVPQGVPHGERWLNKGSAFQMIVIVPYLESLMITYINTIGTHCLKDIDTKHFNPIDRDQIVNLVNSISYFCESKKFERTGRHLCASLFTIIEEATGRGDALKEEQEETKCSIFVERCKNLLFQRMYDSGCNVVSLARELECTPNHLSAKFKSENKIKLTDYLLGLRLDQAKQLLSKSNLTVNQVAWASGFEHPSYFIQRFKKKLGFTPREYRINALQK